MENQKEILSFHLKTDVLEKVGGFNSNFATSADWELWVRLASKGDFYFIDKYFIPRLVQFMLFK